ncbi:hypothetical protein KKH23_07095 [Patescibacteria group bacterium]|uniref:Uncharacterized protein n=1 Tax=viral metagenome TaxID=1070528 RepID=A0A6M3LWC9_9ZZZZ|nr:hypothetical protein [Patescibacteria group bacterium]
MKKELDDLLVKKYPKIFRDRYADMRTTAMCWGFEFSEGWMWLMDSLCNCIQSYIDNNPHLKITQVVAVQTKEKYGSLRFYYDGGDDLVSGMVWLAEHQSYDICEVCGSTKDVGRTGVTTDGWVYTRCKKCAESENLLDWKSNDEIAKDEEQE